MDIPLCIQMHQVYVDDLSQVYLGQQASQAHAGGLP